MGRMTEGAALGPAPTHWCDRIQFTLSLQKSAPHRLPHQSRTAERDHGNLIQVGEADERRDLVRRSPPSGYGLRRNKVEVNVCFFT